MQKNIVKKQKHTQEQVLKFKVEGEKHFIVVFDDSDYVNGNFDNTKGAVAKRHAVRNLN